MKGINNKKSMDIISTIGEDQEVDNFSEDSDEEIEVTITFTHIFNLVNFQSKYFSSNQKNTKSKVILT